MGKGDKKTKRGKIFSGSYGKHRPKKSKGYIPVTTIKDKPEKESIKVEEAEPIDKKQLELKTEEKPKVVKEVKKPKEVKAEKKPKEVKTEKKKKETKKTVKPKTEPKKTAKKKATKKKSDKEK